MILIIRWHCSWTGSVIVSIHISEGTAPYTTHWESDCPLPKMFSDVIHDTW